jgi:hypothetical protein
MSVERTLFNSFFGGVDKRSIYFNVDRLPGIYNTDSILNGQSAVD